MDNEKHYIKRWEIIDNFVLVVYDDYTTDIILKSVWDRSFGPIITSDKDTITRDYSYKG